MSIEGVATAATHQALEADHRAADAGGSVGSRRRSAIEAHRDGTAVARIAQRVAAGAQIEIAAQRAAIAHREGVVIAAQGDVLNARHTTTNSGDRGEGIATAQGGAHRTAVARVAEGVGAGAKTETSAQRTGRIDCAGVIAIAKVHRFDTTETKAINRASVRAGQDQGFRGAGGGDAVGSTRPPHNRFETGEGIGAAI